jgi:hypothetical protein
MLTIFQKEDKERYDSGLLNALEHSIYNHRDTNNSLMSNGNGGQTPVPGSVVSWPDRLLARRSVEVASVLSPSQLELDLFSPVRPLPFQGRPFSLVVRPSFLLSSPLSWPASVPSFALFFSRQ